MGLDTDLLTPQAVNSGMPDPEFERRFNTAMNDGYSIPPYDPNSRDGRFMDKINSKYNTDKLPTVTNDEGGSQSETLGRFDLIPPESAISIAKILGAGAEKYGENNWHKIPIEDHINHALEHIFLHLAGDTSEPHLDHAHCRLAFAIWARENRTIEGGVVRLQRRKDEDLSSS